MLYQFKRSLLSGLVGALTYAYMVGDIGIEKFFALVFVASTIIVGVDYVVESGIVARHGDA